MFVRKKLRWKEFDYTNTGYYFVTICSFKRQKLFGDICEETMCLDLCGQMVDFWWRSLSCKFSLCELDEYIIMPDHLHGIIKIKYNVGADQCVRPKISIPKIIQWFKTMTTNEFIKANRPMNLGPTRWSAPTGKYDESNFKLWQRSYHDRVIRNKQELQYVRWYIRTNPIWE